MRRRGTGTRRWRWSAPALLLVVATSAAPGGGRLTSAPATFSTRGSVEQVSVVHAAPGVELVLRTAGGDVVAVQNADAAGSALWRDVDPGSGYRVEARTGDATALGGPVDVMSATDTPPSTLYASQQLQPGFGYITTRDGTMLSATVTLPGPPDAGPYPTVVEYSGYAVSDPASPQPSTLIAQLLGYATVAVNMRGTGCSGGAFTYFEQLQVLDGYDVIETVAAQPWVAHGKVGMIGISYPGISQLFVAQSRPPHLAAIAPLSVLADTYRSTLYPGGIFNDGFALSWASERAEQAKPYGQGWERAIVDAGGATGDQCAQNQLLRLQNQDLVGEIDANPYYDPALGDPLAPVSFVDRIDVPVFTAGAWQDEQTGGHFAVMWERFANPRLFATNGTHVDSLLAEVNRWYEFLEFYVARRIPKMPALPRLLAPTFIEQQLGIPGVTLEPDRFTGYPSYEAALAAYEAEPPVRVLVENGGVPGTPGVPTGTYELSFDSWPPPQTQPTSWWFQPDQRLSTSPPPIADGDGRAATSYVYDPSAKPRTNYSGASSAIWGALPEYDWRPLPVGRALAFDSDPLSAETVMVGSGSVDLWLRSTAPDTDVEVTLTEVRPDGTEMYVQSGWLRASHRALDSNRATDLRPWHTHTQADAADLPDEEYVNARVELFPFAHVFRPGSRIRITVEAPGGNRPLWTFDTIDEEARNEIAHSAGRPSRVVLPVIPGIDAPDALPACPSLRGQPCRVAYGVAQPIEVTATISGDDATVAWKAPPGARPGLTLVGYRVREAPGGAATDLGTDARSATFPDLAPGPHTFTVEARYADGGGSGRSTPSNTVVAAAGDPVETTTDAPTGPAALRAAPAGREDAGEDTGADLLDDPNARALTAQVTLGDLDPSDPLYPLAQQCAAGDMEACDELYAVSDIGSDLETFGDTCGGTAEVGSGGSCSFGELGDEFDDTTDDGFDEGFDDFGNFDESEFDDFADGPLASTGGDHRNLGLTAGLMLLVGGVLVLVARAPVRVLTARAAPGRVRRLP